MLPVNNELFGGEIPAHCIRYNARFANLAGRITYKPPLIELSPKYFLENPEALRETLLHEIGLPSIYHNLSRAAAHHRRRRR